jgi:cell wall-associated NlpC family hydrolase
VTGRRVFGRVVLLVPAICAGAGVVLLAGVQAIASPPQVATRLARTDIPAGYLADYQQAADACPGLSWSVLAGVGKVESDHGRDPGPSPTGAVGPMQFEPATWASYGVDGDGDGRADPANAADAIVSAAGYLCTLGADRDIRGALIAYNCGNTGPHCQGVSAGYAAAVLGWAARYATTALTSGPTVTGPIAGLAVRTALDQVGTPYIWGGETPGGFDCSGLVQFSYAAAGLDLPRTAQQQYDAGPRLTADGVVVAGDLLFFGSGPRAITHVGIYLGDGRMVDAPHSGALVRVEAVDWSPGHYVGATRPDSGGITA